MVVPGVEQFLESESSDDDDPILLSQEEIKEFLSMFPQLNSQRQQLRLLTFVYFDSGNFSVGKIVGNIGIKLKMTAVICNKINRTGNSPLYPLFKHF